MTLNYMRCCKSFKIMNSVIAAYLQNQLRINKNSLKPMDKRHKIPKEITAENIKLQKWIDHLIK